MALRMTQSLTAMSTRKISWGVKVAEKLTTFMWRLSWNLGASAFRNPQGLSRTVMGLLYLSCIPHKDNLRIHICKGKR
jgi:hypothetical protein